MHIGLVTFLNEITADKCSLISLYLLRMCSFDRW